MRTKAAAEGLVRTAHPTQALTHSAAIAGHNRLLGHNHKKGYVPIACCEAINRRLALSAAKPNRQRYISLGFVALLLNPTYPCEPYVVRRLHSTHCMQQPTGTEP